MMQTKSEIRAYISEIKKSMSDKDIASLSEAIINQLITSDEYINSDNVLVYVSYNQEVRTDILIKQSIKAGKNVYVPKVFKDKDVKYQGIRENKKLPGSCTRIYGNHGTSK